MAFQIVLLYMNDQIIFAVIWLIKHTVDTIDWSTNNNIRNL